MREWNQQGVQKRREERMRVIRAGQSAPDLGRSPGAPVWKKESPGKADDLPWNRPQWMAKEDGKKREHRFILQLFASFLLLTGTYLVFQSEAPAGREAQSFISEVLERDYNFAGVARWYEKTIGGSPAILPAFQEKKAAQNRPQWVAPVKGDLVTSFKEEGRGVIVRTSGEAPVVAAAEGWVVKAGPEEGLGETVILRHADGRETWYGRLGTLQVKEKEWVKPRQLLGEAAGEEEGPLLFFALKRKGAFVDPSGVVPFD